MEQVSKSKNKSIINYIPEILVIAFCLIIQIFFVANKEGYHEDELLSFEMANAYYTPWVTPTQPEGRLAKFMRNEIKGDSLGDTLQNIGFIIADTVENRGTSILATYKADVYSEPVWITSQTFKDYLTVGEEGRFSFTSAYWNIKDDNHPPVHAFLLHFISSIFTEEINPYLGCSINLIFMLGILILLEKAGKLFAISLDLEERSGRYIGVVSALLYGLSWGAVSTVLLIRMYCVLTFFVVASIYSNLRLFLFYENKIEIDVNSEYRKLIAITCLGFLTQYFFLFYCMPMAVVMVVIMLVNKKGKISLRYIRAMIESAAIGLIIFPFSIADVLSSGRGVEALENMAKGFDGFGERIIAFANILGIRTFGSVFIILTLLTIFLISLLMLKQEKLLFITFLPIISYFFLASRMSPYMIDRYIMAIFPACILYGCVGLFLVTSKIKTNSDIFIIILMTLVAILQSYRLFYYDGEYQYKGYQTVIDNVSEYREYPCICVYDGNCYQNLLEFTYFEKSLLVTLQELMVREDTKSINELDKVVVIVKGNVEEKSVRAVIGNYGLNYASEIMKDTVNGDSYYLYEK